MIAESGTTLKIGPKFKANTSSLGVWSPFNRSTEILTKEELAERSSSRIKSSKSQQSPVWSPRSAPPSPASERREFRSIGFESPKPTRRTLTPSPADPSTVVAPPWNQPGYNPTLPVSENFKPYPIQNSASNPTVGASVRSASASTPSQGQATQIRFPPQQKPTITQEPTINTLLKSKDGKTATINESATSESQKKGSTTSIIRSSSSSMTNSSQRTGAGIINPTVKQTPSEGQKSEPASTSLHDNSYSKDRKMQPTVIKIDGIGPITREGMPLTLRSEIDEGNRDKWYKQMYQTLHKTQDDDDYVTVRYKTRRGYPYKSSGYQSEPEANYESDYSIKYNTLDRRRTPIVLSSTSYNKFNTLQSKPTTPQQHHQQLVRSGQSSYKNQPGKIENYIPGRSSISEKESKQQLEHQKLTTSKTYTEGNLSRALKEQGYESDSTLVFRKSEPPTSAALSPVEQKQYYKNMQAGGEVPLQGFRKPAPERPKDCSEDQLESDLMVEIKESMTGNKSNIDNAGQLSMSTDSSTNPFRFRQTIDCYPITNIHRPLDMFGPFPKENRTFVPPVPPSRKSSHSNSTLKIMSQVKTNTINRRTMLERTTTTATSSPGMKHPSKFRSKSAGPLFYGGASSSSSIVTSTSMMKEEKNQENSTRVASKRFTAASYRACSSSPTGQQRKSSQSPVAFGRGISKERTFAEEKKRIEEKLPKIVSVSTSILRNPELKSPNEVKKALRSSYLPIVGRVANSERSSFKRYSSHGTYRSASSIYSSNKSINRVLSPASHHKKDEKSLAPASLKNGSHQQQLKKSFHRKSSTGRTTTPSITIKTSFQKASKVFGLKTKTPSNQSLARTCSTYSIDSTNSKSRRSRLSDGPTNTIPSTRHHARKILLGNSLDRSFKTIRTNSPTPVLQQTHRQNHEQQNEDIRADYLLKKVFLRKHQPLNDTDVNGKPTSVLEKAHMWNSLTCRSEPSLKKSNYYLSRVKPVSSSKFKTKDKQDVSELSTAYHQIVRQNGGDVIEHVNRFESMIKLTDNYQDDQHQFGYVRGRRMEIDYSFHERSRSEPPTEKTTTTTTSTIIQEELIDTGTPRTIVGRRCQIAQRTSRSPSCRRIQYLKGKEGQVKKIIRARSLSGTNGQRARLDKSKNELVRSHSLILSPESSVSRSRFRDLNTFYNSLERLGQLERETSSSSNDLRPGRRMREEKLIDYDLWKRVRVQEKAERELNQLKIQLKQDQREKDLFFLPRDPEDVRWRSDLDAGLRNREKSVEDLKCILNEQALNFEDAKLRDLETRKDHYKPLWRGSSVIDVASQLEEKYITSGVKRDEPQSLDIISSNLLSTLSSEQMKKLKNQLSEIYSNSKPNDPTSPSRVTSEMYQQEEYIINVPERASRLEALLKVRSHSVLTQDKVKQCQLQTQPFKVGNITDYHTKQLSTPDNHKTFQSRSSKAVDRATLSRSLCQELKDKILEKHHTLPSIGKKKKNARPTFIGSEKPLFLSLDSSHQNGNAGHISSIQATGSSKKGTVGDKTLEDDIRKERVQSHCDTESISSETSNKTVIFRSQTLCQTADTVPVEDIKTKIKYFENKQGEENTAVTIYHAREDSSLSEDEPGTKREDSKKSAAKETSGSMITLSQSFTDLKDLFGEKRSASCSAYTATPFQDSRRTSARNMSPKRFTFRSRSSTPDFATCIQTGDVKKIKDKFESLDVNIWRQAEDTVAGSERHYQSDSELSRQPFEVNENRGNEHTDKGQCKQTAGSSIVHHHETGDVSRITHKYEAQSERARYRKSRKDRVVSPIPKNPFRKDDRFMPHINVISKTASLKQEIKPTRVSHHHHPSSKTTVLQTPSDTCALTQNISTGRARRSASSGSEEFEKLKSKFESRVELSLLGKMYTSVPDIRELKDISGYLSCPWIAHQFPRPTDNARLLTAPNESSSGKQIVRKGSAASPDRLNRGHNAFRSLSYQSDALHLHSSPAPRQSSKHPKAHDKYSNNNGADFLKQCYTIDVDKFGEHKEARERSKSNRRLEAEALWRKIQSMTGNSTGGTKGQLDEPPITFEESPRRYIESDVNIHYKTPIRFEYKDPIPDDELAFRQAEHMRRVYQEERRRKYIHELEDMNARRHTDNILPSQKSPIPLNRYDDFPADLSPKPLLIHEPKNIARALYNFQGQSIRELSFRKGDIIYLRRQIDKNWYEGEHNATVGLLPANYIEIITRDNVNVKQPLPKKPTREGKARAKFNFTAQTAVELSLLKGELVTLTRRVDDNWFEGKIGSKKGIFPVSYVEILTDINGEESYDIEPIVSRPQSALGVTSQSSHVLSTHFDNSHTNGRISPGIVRETKTIQKTEVLHVDTSNEPISYRALYNYKPQNTDELELVEGDVVYVLEKCDDGWYVGTSARTGCFGTFPGNYVNKM
uniref:SoHo domain-containing protein n=1 Tax=Anopheles christyi TaxID=43041 RepID=A0A182JST1_9DIPT